MRGGGGGVSRASPSAGTGSSRRAGVVLAAVVALLAVHAVLARGSSAAKRPAPAPTMSPPRALGPFVAIRRGAKTRFAPARDPSSPLSYGDVLRLWRDDAPFRAVFLDALASEPHRAFFWETPPLPPRDRLDAADETEPWPALDRLAYEHAVVPAPHLASREPESETFEPHLADARARGALAAVFPNLGGDAWLVSPAGPDVAGGAHLAAFVRDADEDDKHALVKAMAEAVMRRASEKCRAGRRTPTWVSANGAGVAWVHARIDDAPKYFHTREYAVATE